MTRYTLHDYAASELAYARFLAPALRTAIRSLELPAGAAILDAGCGPGGTLPLFFEPPVNAGRVVGIDASTPHLRQARAVAAEGLSDVVTLHRQDLFATLVFSERDFDAAWLGNVLFPDDTGDEAPAILRRVADRVRPGGKVGVFYSNWLRHLLLPGFAALENLLGGWNELRRNGGRPWNPAFHPENAAASLRAAGLRDVRVSHHPVSWFAPLPPAVRDYVGWHVRTIYARVAARMLQAETLPPELVPPMRQLTGDAAALDALLDDPDYHCSATAILAVGTVEMPR